MRCISLASRVPEIYVALWMVLEHHVIQEVGVVVECINLSVCLQDLFPELLVHVLHQSLGLGSPVLQVADPPLECPDSVVQCCELSLHVVAPGPGAPE